jgi:hypothetical protein
MSANTSPGQSAGRDSGGIGARRTTVEPITGEVTGGLNVSVLDEVRDATGSHGDLDFDVRAGAEQLDDPSHKAPVGFVFDVAQRHAASRPETAIYRLPAKLPGRVRQRTPSRRRCTRCRPWTSASRSMPAASAAARNGSTGSGSAICRTGRRSRYQFNA